MTKEKVYGQSQEPWLYEPMVNALLFFSMTEKERDKFISAALPTNRKLSFEILSDIVIQGFAESLKYGLTFDEWIEDEKLEKLQVENDFKVFNDLDFMYCSSKVLTNWNEVRDVAILIIEKLGLQDFKEPSINSIEIVEDYKVHDTADGWGWDSGYSSYYCSDE